MLPTYEIELLHRRAKDAGVRYELAARLIEMLVHAEEQTRLQARKVTQAMDLLNHPDFSRPSPTPEICSAYYRLQLALYREQAVADALWNEQAALMHRLGVAAQPSTTRKAPAEGYPKPQ